MVIRFIISNHHINVTSYESSCAIFQLIYQILLSQDLMSLQMKKRKRIKENHNVSSLFNLIAKYTFKIISSDSFELEPLIKSILKFADFIKIFS